MQAVSVKRARQLLWLQTGQINHSKNMALGLTSNSEHCRLGFYYFNSKLLMVFIVAFKHCRHW